MAKMSFIQNVGIRPSSLLLTVFRLFSSLPRPGLFTGDIWDIQEVPFLGQANDVPI